MLIAGCLVCIPKPRAQKSLVSLKLKTDQSLILSSFFSNYSYLAKKIIIITNNLTLWRFWHCFFPPIQFSVLEKKKNLPFTGSIPTSIWYPQPPQGLALCGKTQTIYKSLFQCHEESNQQSNCVRILLHNHS